MKKLILLSIIFFSSIVHSEDIRFECNIKGNHKEKFKNIPKEKDLNGKLILQVSFQETPYHIKTYPLTMEVKTFDFDFFLTNVGSNSTINHSDWNSFNLRKEETEKSETIQSVNLDRVSGELSYYYDSYTSNSEHSNKSYSGLCNKIPLKNKF